MKRILRALRLLTLIRDEPNIFTIGQSIIGGDDRIG